MILLDTCIWSEVLRRKRNQRQDVVEVFDRLVREEQIKIIGPIRQELLSGVNEPQHYQRLRLFLRDFQDVMLFEDDFELAAEFCNICRRKGVQGSDVDFLICAVGQRHNLLIFTLDGDFTHYAKLLPVRLYQWRH